MRFFPSGRFDRQHMSAGLRQLSPSSAAERLDGIDLAVLKAAGKRLVLLDVDNTLLPWRSDDIPETTLKWLEQGRDLGFEFCLVSNTRKLDRLARLSGEMKVTYVKERFKPSTRMYRMALARFGAEPREAVMVGDQLLTDVLGANRSGIDAIWVRPISGREFIGTRYVNRMAERVVRLFLYRHIERADGVGDVPFLPLLGPLKYRVVRQFFKFAIVGGSSTVIDVGLHWLLLFVVMVGGRPLGAVFGAWLVEQFPQAFGYVKQASDAAVPVFKVLTAGVAILNSFYWNRLWTFRIRDKARRLVQLHRFITWSVLGMLLNTAIVTMLNNVIAGNPKRSWAIATIVATVVVAFFNFAGQRWWVFKKGEGG